MSDGELDLRFIALTCERVDVYMYINAQLIQRCLLARGLGSVLKHSTANPGIAS